MFIHDNTIKIFIHDNTIKICNVKINDIFEGELFPLMPAVCTLHTRTGAYTAKPLADILPPAHADSQWALLPSRSNLRLLQPVCVRSAPEQLTHALLWTDYFTADYWPRIHEQKKIESLERINCIGTWKQIQILTQETHINGLERLL